MKTCRKCGVSYSAMQCPDCGHTGTDNSIPPPPKICMVIGCGKDTDINFMILRGPAGKPFTPPIAARYLHERGGRAYPQAGYEFVENRSRCGECYHREAGPDWRDEMIAGEIAKHPEIGHADYSDEADRKDMCAIASMFAMRKKIRASAPEDRNSEAVLTGQVITPELIAKADTSIFRGPLHD